MMSCGTIMNPESSTTQTPVAVAALRRSARLSSAANCKAIINPESGSSQTPVVAQRRSGRLSSSYNENSTAPSSTSPQSSDRSRLKRKSSSNSSAASNTPAPTITPQPSNTSQLQTEKKSTPIASTRCRGMHPGITTYPSWNKADRARFFWSNLKISNSRKPDKFRYGPEEEERTCVLPSGETFAWQEKSSGHTWIAVNGVKSHSVVVMDSFPEFDWLVNNIDRHPPVTFVTRTLLKDMHVTASAFNQKVAKRAKRKPFAVVSVAPGTVGGSYEHAIEFLKEKVKGRSALTGSEIVKITVRALKYLFGPKFKPNQLQSASYEWGAWHGSFGKIRTSDVDECLKDFNEATTSNKLVSA